MEHKGFMDIEFGKRINLANLTRIIIVIAGALCVIGLFLPHIRIGESEYATRVTFLIFRSPRLIPLICLGIAGILGGIFKIYMLAAISGLIYCILFMVDMRVFYLIPLYEYYTKSIGFYFMFIGAMALLFFGIVGVADMIINKRGR